MRIRSFEERDTEQVVDLWDRCGLLRPWNDPHRDIARKHTVQPDLFLIGDDKGTVVATAMVGYDGHRGWVNYLAVSPSARNKGYGRALMAEAEARLIALGCPKLSLQVRSDNADALDFYERLGYVADETVSLGKRLIVDE